MKNLKKILAMVLSAAMVLGMSSVSLADNEEKGTITIKNAQFEVTIEGETKTNDYTAYKIFDANPLGDGNDRTEPNVLWGGEDGNTVGYTLSKAAYDAYWKGAEQDLFTFTESAAGPYIVKLNDNIGATEVSAFFSNYYHDMIDVGAVTAYPFSGEATVEVPYGYYFVSSTNGSVVSVDTTNKDVVIVDKNTYGPPFEGTKEAISVQNGTGAVTEIPKEDAEKPVSAAIGDTVGYELKFTTSNYDINTDEQTSEVVSRKITTVYVNDTLGDGMDYILNEDEDVPKITVKIGDEELSGTVLTADQYTALKDGTDPIFQPAEGDKIYYLIYTTEDDQATGATKESFKVVIPWLYEDGNTVFADNSTLDIRYKAIVTALIDEAVGDDAGENSKNTADLKYDVTDPDGPPTPPEDGTDTAVEEISEKVYVYALAIVKVDGETLEKLEGAVFTVTDADGSQIGAVLDEEDGSKTQGYYVFNSSNTENTEDYTTEFVSDEDGNIVIYGVKAGTYSWTEKTAPAGYNLVEASIDLETIVAGTTTTSTTVTTTRNFIEDADGTYGKKEDGTFDLIENIEDYQGPKYKLVSTDTEGEEGPVIVEEMDVNSVSYTVENNKGVELPSTGGTGTTVFYVLGSILVIGAGIIMVAKRRMSMR